MSRPKPLILTILDGWGYRAETKANAIALARKPTYDRLLREWAELGYEDETMEKIFHGNAERILGIPPDMDRRRETRI